MAAPVPWWPIAVLPQQLIFNRSRKCSLNLRVSDLLVAGQTEISLILLGENAGEARTDGGAQRDHSSVRRLARGGCLTAFCWQSSRREDGRTPGGCSSPTTGRRGLPGVAHLGQKRGSSSCLRLEDMLMETCLRCRARRFHGEQRQFAHPSGAYARSSCACRPRSGGKSRTSSYASVMNRSLLCCVSPQGLGIVRRGQIGRQDLFQRLPLFAQRLHFGQNVDDRGPLRQQVRLLDQCAVARDRRGTRIGEVRDEIGGLEHAL
jgi:hypothetical protein